MHDENIWWIAPKSMYLYTYVYITVSSLCRSSIFHENYSEWKKSNAWWYNYGHFDGFNVFSKAITYNDFFFFLLNLVYHSFALGSLEVTGGSPKAYPGIGGGNDKSSTLLLRWLLLRIRLLLRLRLLLRCRLGPAQSRNWRSRFNCASRSSFTFSSLLGCSTVGFFIGFN